jgi:hypothetical protein
MVERTNEEEQAAKRRRTKKKQARGTEFEMPRLLKTLETSKQQENEQQRSLSLLDLKDPDSLTATCSAT